MLKDCVVWLAKLWYHVATAHTISDFPRLMQSPAELTHCTAAMSFSHVQLTHRHYQDLQGPYRNDASVWHAGYMFTVPAAKLYDKAGLLRRPRGC